MQIEGVEGIMTTLSVHYFFTEILLGVTLKRADKRTGTQEDTLKVIHIPTDTEKKAWSALFFLDISKTGNFKK